MKAGINKIRIEPLSAEDFQEYIAVGSKSYNQHYLHLWPDKDPTPYFEQSFRPEVLERELANPNTRLFLIYAGEKAIGILKIVLCKEIQDFSAKEAMLLEKIYLLKECSGMGYGLQVVHFAENYARELQKEVLWLETMQKGPALQFYQRNGFVILAEKLLDFEQAIASERPMYILAKELKP